MISSSDWTDFAMVRARLWGQGEQSCDRAPWGYGGICRGNLTSLLFQHRNNGSQSADAVVAVSLPIEAITDPRGGIPKPTFGLTRGEEGNFRITPTGDWKDPSLHEGG